MSVVSMLNGGLSFNLGGGLQFSHFLGLFIPFFLSFFCSPFYFNKSVFLLSSNHSDFMHILYLIPIKSDGTHLNCKILHLYPSTNRLEGYSNQPGVPQSE